MIKALAHMVIMGLLLLSPALGWAQRSPVTHNFHKDSPYAEKLRFANGNKTGITPLLTYTCSNNAVFGSYSVSGLSYVCINMPGKDDFVTTTAVDSLRGLQILFYPETEKRPNIKLYLSRDSIHWSDSIVSDLMYNWAGSISASFVPGRYYVRLVNAVRNKSTYLRQIKYTFGDCNCVLYIPEE